MRDIILNANPAEGSYSDGNAQLLLLLLLLMMAGLSIFSLIQLKREIIGNHQ